MIYGQTHIGYVRANNEDAMFYDEKQNIMVVADGIGGHAHGEDASRLAVETLCNYLYQHNTEEDKMLLLRSGFEAANQAVHALQENLEDVKICGTTLSAALIYNGILYFAHVGDSRIYVSRQKRDIEQITLDHTYLSELARNDFKTFVELQRDQLNRAGNYLTRAIGPEDKVEPHCGHFKVMKDDYIILLTDGVYKYLKPDDLLEIVQTNESIKEMAETMIARSLSLGGKDNLTAVIAQYEGR